jgi:hypothetical protein
MVQMNLTLLCLQQADIVKQDCPYLNYALALMHVVFHLSGNYVNTSIHYHSEKVVIVIVWLCNLHSAPGVNGEISP